MLLLHQFHLLLTPGRDLVLDAAALFEQGLLEAQIQPILSVRQIRLLLQESALAIARSLQTKAGLCELLVTLAHGVA
jgi:hypothetical protein